MLNSVTIFVSVRKRNIWILATLSGLALTGLIVVQLVWIRNAISLQQRQFDQLVSKTMNQIINDLETHETQQVLDQILTELSQSSTDSLADPVPGTVESTPVSPSPSPQDDVHDYYFFQNQSSFNVEAKIDLISGDTVYFVRENTLYNYEDPIQTPASVTRKSSVNDEYLEMFSGKRIFIDKVFNQMVRETPSIETRVSYPLLDSIIRVELSEMGIEMPYEFAVRTGDSRYLFRSGGFQPETAFYRYSNILFPRDNQNTPNFLVIYFPTRDRYVFQSVEIMAGSSLTLALLILIISTIAIVVIFRQKKLSEIKNDFISNMTHELKTPISTISLASQWLTDKEVDPSTRNTERIAELIREESHRLGNQVERVLQISLFDEGKMQMKQELIWIDELVAKAVEKITLQVDQQQGELHQKLTCSGLGVKGDPAHLTNVVYNLLDNAIKYSRGKPVISVETYRKQDQLHIVVSDQGIGISREYQNRIFEQFFRVPTGNVHNVKGFGLGLSYVQKILQLHGGRITLKSESGHGSTFTAILPLLKEEKNA